MTSALPHRFDTRPFLAGVLVLLVLAWGGLRSSMPATEWVMVNVSNMPFQADAHLIRAGKTSVLIDTGTEEGGAQALVPYLASLGVRELDHVFVTHPHKDHYGGINALLDAGIPMKHVYFFMPYKPQCDVEIPWGCDWIHLRATLERLHRSGIPLHSAWAGTKVELSPQARIEVLHAYDGINTPAGPTDINDLSLIMRLTHGPTSVLFSGDLNHLLGTYLGTLGTQMKATLLKIPHHGAEGAAPNTFYEAVAPQEAMVPAPAELWCSLRSMRTRLWMAEHKVPVHVNGFHGHVSVLIQESGYRVRKQLPAPNELCMESVAS